MNIAIDSLLFVWISILLYPENILKAFDLCVRMNSVFCNILLNTALEDHNYVILLLHNRLDVTRVTMMHTTCGFSYL